LSSPSSHSGNRDDHDIPNSRRSSSHLCPDAILRTDTQRRIVSAWIGAAFAQDDAPAARKQWREVADQARPRVPKLAALMDDAEADVPAYMCLLVEHRAKLHSTNPLDGSTGSP
jgi:hypothetical protein